MEGQQHRRQSLEHHLAAGPGQLGLQPTGLPDCSHTASSPTTPTWASSLCRWAFLLQRRSTIGRSRSTSLFQILLPSPVPPTGLGLPATCRVTFYGVHCYTRIRSRRRDQPSVPSMGRMSNRREQLNRSAPIQQVNRELTQNCTPIQRQHCGKPKGYVIWACRLGRGVLRMNSQFPACLTPHAGSVWIVSRFTCPPPPLLVPNSFAATMLVTRGVPRNGWPGCSARRQDGGLWSPVQQWFPARVPHSWGSITAHPHRLKRQSGEESAFFWKTSLFHVYRSQNK